MFSARVPLVRALEHCNINDTEIESSSGPAEGASRSSARRERERERESRWRSASRKYPLSRASRIVPPVRNHFVICFFEPLPGLVSLCTDDTEIDGSRVLLRFSETIQRKHGEARGRKKARRVFGYESNRGSKRSFQRQRHRSMVVEESFPRFLRTRQGRKRSPRTVLQAGWRYTRSTTCARHLTHACLKFRMAAKVFS